MKKFLALFLALMMVFALVACSAEVKKTETKATETKEQETKAEETKTEETATTGEETSDVMSYAEYVAAEVDDPVVIESFVQAKQSWWNNKASVYLQDTDGAYFVYNMTCSEEDYAKLEEGTCIRVTGFKAEWSGEVEIAEGATFEFVDGVTFVANPEDVTAFLGTDDLINHQNQKVVFKGLTIAAYDEGGNAFAYKNTEEKTDDLYFKATLNGETYNFCVEFYLCGKDTDVYKAVEALNVGDVVDIEGFLYWYNGANPHVTAITVVG